MTRAEEIARELDEILSKYDRNTFKDHMVVALEKYAQERVEEAIEQAAEVAESLIAPDYAPDYFQACADVAERIRSLKREVKQ